MNFKKQARQLEELLEIELKESSPLVFVNNNMLLYKTFKIKKSSNGWQLINPQGNVLDEFHLRATAALAARFVERGDYKKYRSVVNLDLSYSNNVNDNNLFKERLKTSKDPAKQDIFLARLTVSSARTKHYRNEISSMFRLAFDK
jgi:hypothetical protein